MKAVLLGAGSHARVVLDILRASAVPVEVLGLLDAHPEGKSETGEVEGHPVLSDFPAGATTAVPAMGDGAIRRAMAERAGATGLRLLSVVHPSAVVSERATLGPGVVLCAGAIVGTGAILGEGVIVNTGATVDHDCQLGPFCHIAPGAHLAGRVAVGEGAWVGIGASVRQGVRIGKEAVVGAGAAVVADVPEGVTVVGVPARVLRK